ncbi:transglutaminase, partial [Pseudomonas sp. FW305-130]
DLLDYRLTISPSGRVSPARAEAGLANVMRMVVDAPVRHLTIESVSRIKVDRPVPMPSNGSPPLREIAAAARASRDPSPAGPANYIFPSP